MPSEEDLLQEEVRTNRRRIGRLKEHQRSARAELEACADAQKRRTLEETLRRIEKNLALEYKRRDGLAGAAGGAGQDC